MSRSWPLFSGQLLLALTQAGASREEAYEWVQRNALTAWDEEKDLNSLVFSDAEITSRLSADAIERVFSLDTYLRNIDKVFARVFA